MTDSVRAWECSLVARIVAGDDSALAIAYDQYGSLVFGIAAKLLGRDHASDLTQEVFVALWEQPGRFDAERGSLRTFLATIARRRCIDHLRRSGRRVANEQRAERAMPIAVPNVEEAAMAMLNGERVRAALDVLPHEQRRSIELAYYDGLTFREVAAVTGASEGTAKSRIRLGLRKLATALMTEGQVERA